VSGENEGSAQQDPGTSQEQIKQQVLLDQIMPLIPFAGPAYQLSRTMPAPGGAGYEFDPAQADAVIKQLQDVIDKANTASSQILTASMVVPSPADDGPSTRQAAAVVKSLGMADERNKALMEYAKKFIAKIQASKAGYGDTEQQNSGNVGKQM
jgi:hypothetical protein